MGGVVEIIGWLDADEVMRDTWGHLDAKPGVPYHGTITFAEGAFGGERIILASEFGDAGYGPWFHQGIHDWLMDQDTEPGMLYHFTGYYLLTPSGEHTFTGTINDVSI
jgi:hypothetical protein